MSGRCGAEASGIVGGIAGLAAIDLAWRMGIIAAQYGQLGKVNRRAPDSPDNAPIQREFEMASQPVETVEVTSTRVACDGGPGTNGHPKVYLTLTKEGQVECPYCGKRFVLKAGAQAEAH
jgi:uncharacterized Zn-finger protein